MHLDEHKALFIKRFFLPSKNLLSHGHEIFKNNTQINLGPIGRIKSKVIKNMDNSILFQN